MSVLAMCVSITLVDRLDFCSDLSTGLAYKPAASAMTRIAANFNEHCIIFGTCSVLALSPCAYTLQLTVTKYQAIVAAHILLKLWEDHLVVQSAVPGVLQAGRSIGHIKAHEQSQLI